MQIILDHSTMKESLFSFNAFAARRLSPLKLIAMAVLLAAGIAAGITLPASAGPAWPYVPLLLVVIVNSWLGGIWLSLITQFLGAACIFAFASRPTSSSFSAGDVWSILAFLFSAEAAMLLVLNSRFSSRLRNTSEQLELIAQATHDCIWEWNLQTGGVWRSGKVAEIFGFPAERVLPSIDWWREHIDPEQVEDVWASLQSAIRGPAERWEKEYRLRHENGSFITVSDRARILRNSAGIATRVLGGMADISAQQIAGESMLRHASHDALTGIPNRTSFLRYLEEAGTNAAGQAILFLDLDGFKQVNDRYGHQIGDQLLASVAGRLHRHLGPQDMVARFGGDEFTILVDGIATAGEALGRAEQILVEVKNPFAINNLELSISGSIGVAFTRGGSPMLLVQQADFAMYQAKRDGRGQCQIYDPDLGARARARVEREAELRQSFTDGSLRLHYQPIISLQNGSLSSFEALLRWQHPQLGMILPSDILPVAESAGLSILLGKWVIRETVASLRAWRDNQLGQSLDMNFNLSGAEFTRPELVDEIRELLHETGIPGESLILELTETTIMESNVDAAQRLSRLRNMGIRLALDDFGKGHSSLGRLQDFPISILKIDSSFVSQIGTGKHQILDAIIALAHKLDLEITAEGVETRQQMAYLRDRGAAKVQGLLFSPALSAESATQILRKQPWNLLDHLESVQERSSGIGAS